MFTGDEFAHSGDSFGHYYTVSLVRYDSQRLFHYLSRLGHLRILQNNAHSLTCGGGADQ